MGQLAAFLQQEFQRHCPPGWQAQSEAPLLAEAWRQILGYAPQADVLLTHENGRRLWVEFEVSRADPVANHAKFATAHLFQPQPDTDIFLSMISPHVKRGRRNLAANAVWLMRYAGMQAYQTPLLPHVTPQEIHRLNHLDQTDLMSARLNIKAEIRRVLDISRTLACIDDTAIHFVSNHTELMLNLHQWNEEIKTASGQSSWGRRTVTYFVYDPVSRRFAPSKFCAYVSIPMTRQFSLPISGATMTLGRYAQIDHDEPIFDGQRAHRHLTANLAMTLVAAPERPELFKQFQLWRQAHEPVVHVHPVGPRFLVPPAWF